MLKRTQKGSDDEAIVGGPATLGDRFTKRVDPFATGVPSFFTTGDFDAMIDEPSSNGVFGFVDSRVECLAVFHERAKLTMHRRDHCERLGLSLENLLGDDDDPGYCICGRASTDLEVAELVNRIADCQDKSLNRPTAIRIESEVRITMESL